MNRQERINHLAKMLETGRLLMERKKIEYGRVVSCKRCRDYHILNIAYKDTDKRNMRKEQIRCSCDGARESKTFKQGMKSLTVLIDKEVNILCRRCFKKILYLSDMELPTAVAGPGNEMDVVCSDCRDSAGFTEAYRNCQREYDKLIKEQEADYARPRLTKEEIIERFKRSKPDGSA